MKNKFIIIFSMLFFVSALFLSAEEKKKKDSKKELSKPQGISCTATIPSTGVAGVAVQFQASVSGPWSPGGLIGVDNIVGNMRYVPATGEGGFSQGSPSGAGGEPCRDSNEAPFTHILTRNIAVMETEVTRQMWQDLEVVQSTLPGSIDPTDTSFGSGMNNPVQRITWYEAVLFANLLSVQNGYTRCYYKDSSFNTPVDSTNYTSGSFYCNFSANGYRLPTEGEWEFFTRAGTSGPFSIDEPNYSSSTCSDFTPTPQLTTLETVAVFCANDNGRSEPVGSKNGNPWNLKDVHGNVSEWCWDWRYTVGSPNYPYPSGTQTDYTGPSTGANRVFRGGSWYNYARYCRSAYRKSYPPDTRYYLLGFRLVRSL